MNIEDNINMTVDNKESYRKWVKEEARKSNGDKYKVDYIYFLDDISKTFPDELSPYSSIFAISNIEHLDNVIASIKSNVSYENYDKRKSGSPNAGLELYKKYLLRKENTRNYLKDMDKEETSINNTNTLSRNLIYFGAPGTGKSYTLNEDRKKHFGENYERVTFHPDYSYAHFVGTYKPEPKGDGITYSYVPGPFMRTYVKALKNPDKPVLLVIEEINRANVAAVFGDVFQLLDRDETGKSLYPIHASEDVKKYLEDNPEVDCAKIDCSKLSIPANMYIWATMNSADQGVFPMDTAFKRRWDFIYRGINEGDNEEVFKSTVTLGFGKEQHIIVWNDLRKAINKQLLEFNVNEDKLIGPYFIQPNISREKFVDVFKNKVIMYLFDDAAKQKRRNLFSGCAGDNWKQYSEICREFDQKGVYIFCEDISGKFPKSTEG